MPENPIGVGIVGLSAQRGWAAMAHLPALNAIADYEVRGVAGSSPASAKSTSAAFGIRYGFADAVEMAAHPDIDLVVVAVRVPHHRGIIENVLRSRKMVYCEWPLALDLEEARTLAGLATDAGARAFVGLQGRAASANRHVRDLIAGGLVGDVLSTTIVASGGGWRPKVASHNAYLFDRSNGATMLTIPFGHAIDTMQYVLGPLSGLSAVSAIRRPTVTLADSGGSLAITSPDQVAMHGTLRSGAVVSVHYRSSIVSGTQMLWEINGTEGSLQISGSSGHVQYGDVAIRHLPATGEARAITTPPAYRPLQSLADARAESVGGNYLDVRNDIRSGTQTAPGFEAAVQLHRVLRAVEIAADTGQWQVLDPD